MRWKGRRSSVNVEDRRGRSISRKVGMGGGLATVVLALAVYLLGGDPSALLQESPGSTRAAPQPYQESAAEARLREFVAVVLADTEDTWGELFADRSRRYQQPRLVLFTAAVDSACGTAPSAAGPFYCPADRQIYLDLSFFGELSQRFGAPGDFAQAYVVAHEVGHHVQTELGISQQVHRAGRGLAPSDVNALSVRQELQADCFAGIWAHHANRSRQLLESGDIEEGLAAAAAIGDDRLQRQAGATVDPDSFTHGSSAQRVAWFRRGLQQGHLEACDTFEAAL